MAPLITITDLRGGRNGFDPPHTIPDNQVVEALNVDWFGASLARRRGGAIAISLSGGTAYDSSGITRLYRFQPGSDDGLAELWSLGYASTDTLFKRLAAGTTWADVSGGTKVDDANLYLVETTTLDGRLYIAGKSVTGSRLMVYDPALTTIRYVGFPTPAVPTAGNTGSGSYPAVYRYYRVRWIQKVGSIITRRSEPSTAVAFTPSGSGTHARVTQPTVAGEGETHWEIEVSRTIGPGEVGIAPFFKIGTVVIATTTFDDNISVDDYVEYPLSADTGEYTTWTNVRYIITDGNRLIGAGSHITGEPTSRIYFSAVMGSTDEGDVERVPNSTTHKNYLPLNENDGGSITGLAPSINGSFYAFKRRQIWRLTPTGDDVTPYTPRLITSAFGALSQASICAARDAFGNPALYFWGEEGPCRLVTRMDGSTATQYLGEDIRDLTILSVSDSLSYSQAYPHTVYYQALHQVWFFFRYTGSLLVYAKAVFDINQGVNEEGNMVRGGWSVHGDPTSTNTTQSPAGVSSVMFSKTIAASMGKELVPYVTNGNSILRCDTTDTTDATQNFHAYIRTKPLRETDFGRNGGMGVSNVLADPASNTSITQTYIRDFGLETRTSTVSLTAAASETKVIRKFENAEIAGAGAIQVQLGDFAAVAATQWKLHEWSGSVYPQEPR